MQHRRIYFAQKNALSCEIELNGTREKKDNNAHMKNILKYTYGDF